MRTLKSKFVLLHGVTLVVSILVFASIIYIVNVSTKIAAPPKQVIGELEIISNRQVIITRREELDRPIQRINEIIRQEEKKRYRRTLVAIVPPVLVGTLLVAYLVSSYLVKPIEDATEDINAIADAPLGKQLPVIKSSEEIETLVSSFNRLLQKVEEAYKSQERFIQDAAHELRTPLAAMKTNIQVYKEKKELSHADIVELLNLIEKMNEKLIQLNENLLVLNGQPIDPAQYQTIDLGELVEETIEYLSFAARKKDIVIDFENQTSSAKTNLDIKKFAIALKNIIDNAIKYSTHDGHIEIKLIEENKTYLISVRDSGIGISPEDLNVIFERFYRGNNSSYAEGEGLGLAIAKQIVEQHGGSLSVTSTVGEGSVFRIVIPKIL